MYRPDIAFSVNLLARFSSAPTRRHWVGIQTIFRYLKGTIDMGLYYKYKKSDENKLIVSKKMSSATGSSKLPKSMDAKAWSRYGYGNTPSYSETPNDVLVGFADAGYLSDPHTISNSRRL